MSEPNDPAGRDVMDFYGPNWTPEMRVLALENAGFFWVSGTGPSALWQGPDGKLSSELNALTEIGTPTPKKPDANTGNVITVGGRIRQWNPQTATYDIDLGPSASGAGGPVQSWGFSNVGGTLYRTNPYTGAVEGTGITDPSATKQVVNTSRGAGVYDSTTGTFTLLPQTAPVTVAYGGVQGVDPNTAAQLGATAQNQLGQQTWQAGQNTLDRQAQAALQQGQQQWQSGENALGRQFTAGENSLDRALNAGKYAADYALGYEQAAQQAKTAALNASKTYTDLSAAPDLTGYARFYAAGGGNAGNAIARHATSFTPVGQLGAARALQVAEMPSEPLLPPSFKAFYTPGSNPYAFAAPAPLTIAPPIAAPAAAPKPAAPATWTGADNIARPVLSAGDFSQNVAAFNALPAETKATVPQAVTDYYATQKPGAPTDSAALNAANAATMRLFEEAQKANAARLGESTGDQPVRYAFGTGRARGTFIAGDSTDPEDPAAGGAHPERIRLLDPPGPNNAEAEVDPMTRPGVGPTDVTLGREMMGGGTMPARLGKLFEALGDLLGSDDEMPMGQGMGRRFAWGTAPRYAYGTDPLAMVTPEDTPYLQQNARLRALAWDAPFGLPNTQSAVYGLGLEDPTVTRIREANAQTATSAPSETFSAEAQRYAPVGLLMNPRFLQTNQQGW